MPAGAARGVALPCSTTPTYIQFIRYVGWDYDFGMDTSSLVPEISVKSDERGPLNGAHYPRGLVSCAEQRHPSLVNGSSYQASNYLKLLPKLRGSAESAPSLPAMHSLFADH
jgi:hypothetical protein